MIEGLLDEPFAVLPNFWSYSLESFKRMSIRLRDHAYLLLGDDCGACRGRYASRGVGASPRRTSQSEGMILTSSESFSQVQRNQIHVCDNAMSLFNQFK